MPDRVGKVLGKPVNISGPGQQPLPRLKKERTPPAGGSCGVQAGVGAGAELQRGYRSPAGPRPAPQARGHPPAAGAGFTRTSGVTRGWRAGSARGRVRGARRASAADVGLRCACPADLPPARPRAAQVVTRELPAKAKGRRTVPVGLATGGRRRAPHVTGGRGRDGQPGGPGLRGARQASGRTLAGQAGPPCGGAPPAAPVPRPSRGSARTQAKRPLRWAESASLPAGMENCPRSPRAARDRTPAGPR